ncbi:MAG TPA: hypothetical protein VL225_18930, partial [Vicinamibacterales bacterium]|nr:hypothetical protein [Vicinamibacterales bacterium]
MKASLVAAHGAGVAILACGCSCRFHVSNDERRSDARDLFLDGCTSKKRPSWDAESSRVKAPCAGSDPITARRFAGGTRPG